MGESKITPLTTPTPLNRQSPNIAHVITSTISPHTPHLVKVTPGITSPDMPKLPLNFILFLCTQKSFYRPRAQAVEPISTRDTSTDAYSRRVVPFGGQRTTFSHLHPQNPQKPHFWAHTMESLCKIHICITAWFIEIWRTCRHSRVLAPCVKICPLGGVWGDQQLPVFILGPPPYLSN